MNIIKKLDRVTQWAGEKMGQETKTAASEDFKALELEMALRHDGESANALRGLFIDSFYRNGQIAQVYDDLHQVTFKAQRN